MREVDDLLRALETPEPPERPPAWPEPRPPFWRSAHLWLPVSAALAAALLLWIALPHDPQRDVQMRGIEDELPIQLDLRMVVERGGVAVRVSSGSALRTGERVLFRVQADRPAEATLWVEGPMGNTAVASPQVGTRPQDVGDRRGLVGYRFDTPGRYVFRLAPTEGSCQPCPEVEVVVLPMEDR